MEDKEQVATDELCAEDALSFQQFIDEASLFRLGELKRQVKLPTAGLGRRQAPDMQSTVQSEYDKIVAKWREVPERPCLDCPRKLHNPLVTPAELRKACRRFKVGTALPEATDNIFG